MAGPGRGAVLAARLRSATPARVVPLMHRARLGRDLRTPRKLQQAREHMEFLVGAARPEITSDELDDLARRYLDWTRWRIETRWHIDRWHRPVPVEGVEHLAAGRDGAVVNFLHHGPFERVGMSLAQHGHHIHMMMAPWFFEEPVKPWLQQHRRITEEGCSIFSSAEGSDGVRRRLREGQLVAMASDMPGSTPVRFVGRDLLGTFGAARLPYAEGRPVLVVTSHRRPDGTAYMRVHEPLHPQDFSGPRELLDRMLQIHEPAVLAWPESYEEPRSKWGAVDHLVSGS